MLSWAMTVHKSQVQTLDAVEVHCGKQFAPGHLYIALLRVRSLSRLRVVGFECRHLVPPSNEVLRFLDNLVNVAADEQSNYCHIKIPTFANSSDLTSALDEEKLLEGELEEIDELIGSYFASSTPPPPDSSSLETVDLTEVMKKLSSSENFESTPANFDCDRFLRSLFKTEMFSRQITELQCAVNEVFKFFQQDVVVTRTKLFLGM